MTSPRATGASAPSLRLIRGTATLAPDQGPGWRKARGLLTVRDKVRRYLAVRSPRGAYRIPLPEDLIRCGREART